MSKKYFYIALALLVVLYFVAVSLNIFGGKKKTNAGQAAEKPWIQTMDNIMASFAPKLDLSRVFVETEGQCTIDKTSREMMLRNDCKLGILQKSGEKYQNALLQFPSSLVIKVFNGNKEYQQDSYKNCNKITSDTFNNVKTILVAYKPSGSGSDSGPDPMNFLDKPQSICWEIVEGDGETGTRNVKIVVLEEGGDLQFSCLACKKKGKIDITIK